MGITVRNVAFDCTDAYRVASFWSAVFGVPLSEDDQPGDPVATVDLPQGFTLYFENVPEPKTVKNRVHLCLTPDGTRDLEIERIVALGGSVLYDRREPDGLGWVVFADPEGNEFCVLRGAADHQADHTGAPADQAVTPAGREPGDG